jgi:hypothetical protein
MLKFLPFRGYYEVYRRRSAEVLGVVEKTCDEWGFRAYDNWKPSAEEQAEIDSKVSRLNQIENERM